VTAPYESAVGATHEWYTPPALFEAIGMTFDLDPCSPMAGPVPWVPAKRFYNATDNGLVQPWEGRAWVNPPYGPMLPKFLHRLVEHGDGIALIPARTETRAFQAAAPRASTICFLRDRVHFIRQDGLQARSTYPSVLLAFGPECGAYLAGTNLGWTVGP
jgi:hypothetical protein